MGWTQIPWGAAASQAYSALDEASLPRGAYWEHQAQEAIQEHQAQRGCHLEDPEDAAQMLLEVVAGPNQEHQVEVQLQGSWEVSLTAAHHLMAALLEAPMMTAPWVLKGHVDQELPMAALAEWQVAQVQLQHHLPALAGHQKKKLLGDWQGVA